MKRLFLGEELKRDGCWYAVQIAAGSEAEAITVCEREGYVYKGEIFAIVQCGEGVTPEEAQEALEGVAGPPIKETVH